VRPAIRQSPRPDTASGTARSKILAAARKLAGRSADGTFAITEVLAEMRRAGTAYQESDFQRIGAGRYRLRHQPQADGQPQPPIAPVAVSVSLSGIS
jgi:hypothetical protein